MKFLSSCLARLRRKPLEPRVTRLVSVMPYGDKGQWSVHIKGENGEITEVGEGYISRAHAEREAHALCRARFVYVERVL